MVDLAHRENNEALHVSAASLNAAVRKMEGDGVGFNIGPRPDTVERVFFGSFWTFTQAVSLVLDRFGVPVEDAERVSLFSARDFYVVRADDVRAVGRNDPCPCGSGAKFKRCHGA